MVLPDNIREFSDTDTTRNWLYEDAAKSLQTRFPIEDDQLRLELHNVKVNPKTYDMQQQKDALLRNRQLRVPISGTWRLIDRESGNVLDERNDTVMQLPYLTDRGTTIYNGNEYSSVSQSRLKSGAYTRIRRSGEPETFFNVKPRSGKSFRMWMQPETGVFKVSVGQSNIPAYHLMRAVGVTDQELIKTWGPEVAEANIKASRAQDLQKLYSKFGGYRAEEGANEATQRAQLINFLQESDVDPDVIARTLGIADNRGINPAVLLRATQKMLNVTRREEEADDRDAPKYSNILSIEDLISERIDNDAGQLARGLLWKIRRDRNLKRIPMAALNPYVDNYLFGSRLTMPLEETNPLSILEQMSRVTKLGEGGISSAESITDEARDVNIGQLGFVDPVAGPESLGIGIDVRTAFRTYKGRDKQYYAAFNDVRTGETAYIRPEDLDNKVLGFPGSMVSKLETVPAVVNGKIMEVSKDRIDYEVPSFAHMMSSHTSLNPMPTGVQPARAFYGAKFWSQYMPQAHGEVPLVDSVLPDEDTTFSEYYGRKIGSLKSPVRGVVTRVNDDGVTITDDAGEKHNVGMVKYFPYNRITGISYFPTVQKGDVVEPKQMVAHSNFTDPKTGSLTMGQNLRTAVIPYKGKSVTGDTSVFWRLGNGTCTYGPISDVPIGTGMQSIAMSDDYASQMLRVHSYMLHAPDSKLSCITTADGMQVKATASHSFVGFFGDAVRECTAEELLQTGALVPVIQPDIPFGTGPEIITCESYAGKAESHTFQLDRDFGWVVGLFIAEGCTVIKNNKAHHVVFSATEQAIIDKLTGFCGRHGISSAVRLSEHANGKSGSVSVWSAAIATWFHDNCGRYAWYKRIPDCTWTAPKDFAEGLIDGYWCGDGTCTPKQVTATTTSRLLADGLTFLLGSFGIRATYREYQNGKLAKRPCYQVHIFSEFLDRMPELSLGYKQQALAKLVGPVKFSRDRIPIPVSELPVISKLAGHKLGNDQYVSRGRLCKWYDELPPLTRKLVDSPVWWDYVKRIDPCKSEEYVYDLDMRPLGNFAIGGGWIVHNSYEDAFVISQEAAEKLATDRLYGFDREARHGVELGKNKYISLFSDKFKQEQLANLDDQGVVQPGTVVNKGDPLILAVGPKLLSPEDAQLGKLHKALRNAHIDRSVTWENDYPGTVVDAVQLRSGAKVNVTSRVPVQVGDKLCYDSQTEILTGDGWKNVSDVTLTDTIATLDPATDVFNYIRPKSLHAYKHTGDMYRLVTSSLDMCVTPNHRLYVKILGEDKHTLLAATDAIGKCVSHKKDGVWTGSSPGFVYLPECVVGHGWGTITREPMAIAVDTFMVILGAWLSNGNLVWDTKAGEYGIDITQVKGNGLEPLRAELDAATIAYSIHANGTKLRIYGKQWALYFKQFGCARYKYIPQEMFTWARAQQQILFKWLMWGDGHVCDSSPICYSTASARLADDVQRLCLHVGYAGHVRYGLSQGGDISDIIEHDVDSTITFRHALHDVRIISTELQPQINHGNVHNQHAQTEGWIPYDGYVYCVEMPIHNVVYVRRNGYAVWCGNSTRYGLKGVVGTIVDQDKMPRDPGTDEPYHLLLNPMGILSRVAPAQLVELALGKIASKTGKQIRLPQEAPEEGWNEWALAQLSEHNMTDRDPIFDPEKGRNIDNIGTGNIYVMAFHHLGDKKLSGRGSSGMGYTAEEQPSKGGGDTAQAKRMSSMDMNALLAHGATEVIKDAVVIRGAKNDEYWKALKLGLPLPKPTVPFIYDKFLATLKAGGINIREQGNMTTLLPMTDADVDKMSRGVIDNSGLVDDNMDPIKGGLFDVGRTGGIPGKFWSHIELGEPVPNPVFEEPIRRMLGLTQKQYLGVIAGEQEIAGATGGAGMRKALENIDVDRDIEAARRDVERYRGAARDDAVKRMGYLMAAKREGIHPSQWMISKVPVLPPVFRPISRMGDVTLQADLNELYRDLVESAESLRTLRKDIPDAELADEKMNLYNAVTAAFGLGDPITPEGRSRRIKGAIHQIIGDQPKTGLFQNRVISKTVDAVGRGVVSPDPNLDMDSIGIPEDSAWELYNDHVIRRLVRQNIPVHRALELVRDRDKQAKAALEDEMAYRPVLMDRAPTWHKFNLLAFHPHIAEGSTVRVSPLITKGFTMDFDGDTVNFHVPASPKAVDQAKRKMLPSKNLFSLTDLRSIRHSPQQELGLGIYQLTQDPSYKPIQYFANQEAAIRAYKSGKIKVNDPIEIRG